MYEDYEHIFRAYDIRGIFGRDLTPEIMARIGGAISNYYISEYAVGGDIRFSTEVLKKALISGLISAGSSVVDIGAVPIGVAMFSTKNLGYAMAYVTASHLPPEWNGVKLSRRGGDLMLGGDIYRIRDIFLGEISWEGLKGIGYYRQQNIVPQYISFLKSLTKEGKLRIVVDCGNGASALIVPQLLRDLGHVVYTVNCDIDPRFPGRGSEPSPENISDLSRSVVEYRADFGVAFDGDGDRTIFTDEMGRPLSAEQAAIVMLEGIEKGNIVANVECSMILEDYVREYGGSVTRVPVGRAYMVKEMANGDYVLGVESSGHYVTYRNANMDDGIVTLLYFTEAIMNIGKPISSVVPQVPYRKRIKVEMDDKLKFKVVELLARALEEEYGNITTTDGVRVDFDYGWILIRPSNTEPLIRITVEAKSQGKVDELVRKFLNKIEWALEKVKGE